MAGSSLTLERGAATGPGRAAGSDRRWSRWRTILLGLVVCYTVARVGYSLARYSVFGRDPDTAVYGMDVRRAVDEAAAWKRTGQLNFKDVIYPPLYYALLLPLTGLEFRIVERVLYVGQFLLYGLAVVLLVKTVSRDRAPTAMEYVAAALLTANFQPLLETAALYKVEGIEFALICLAFYAFSRRWDRLTGFLIVTAAGLKYLPGILALYFLVKREWRVVQGMGFACAVYFVALLPIFGLETLWAYLRYPLTLLFGGTLQGTGAVASLEFQTLTGTVNRWFAGLEGMRTNLGTQHYAEVPHAEIAAWISRVLQGVLLLVYGWTIGRRRVPAAERDARWTEHLCGLSLTLILVYIIMPVSLIHYAVLLLPAFIVTALVFLRSPGAVGAPARWLFWAGYLLVAVVIPGGVVNQLLPPHPVWQRHHIWVYFWWSFPFYGYLLLGGSLWLCHRRVRSAGSGGAA